MFDRDAKYGLEIPIALRSMKIAPVQTSYQSPWQNGIAERWVQSCRRGLLDHVMKIALISGLRKIGLEAGFTLYLLVEFFAAEDLEACITATTERPSPHQRALRKADLLHRYIDSLVRSPRDGGIVIPVGARRTFRFQAVTTGN
jgi:hypothetical protein